MHMVFWIAQIRLITTNTLITVLLGVVLVIGFFLQMSKAQENRKARNNEIEKLSAHNRELLEKYKSCLANKNVNGIGSTDQEIIKKAIEIIERNIRDLDFLKTLNNMK